MSDPISFVMPGAVPSPLNANIPARQTAQTPQKSFAETLNQKQTDVSQKAATPSTDSTQPIADYLRQSLEQEYQRVPLSPGESTRQLLGSQLTELRNPINYLRDAVGGLNRTPTGSDLNGMFKNIETEWFDLEQALRTVNDYTTGGQLLGLQARLYKVAQHIEVMSKVVDQTTGGLKTIINTNV